MGIAILLVLFYTIFYLLGLVQGYAMGFAAATKKFAQIAELRRQQSVKDLNPGKHE